MSGLCFVDTETTGLNPNVHEAYEVAWALDDGPIQVLRLPHSLRNADPAALKIGGYRERGFNPNDSTLNLNPLRKALQDVTLVGSNPAFDAAFLTNTLGYAPWRHRLIDVADGALWLFGWDRPEGLVAVADVLREGGREIPEPDHTARGDVEATRAVYYALRDWRGGLS